MYMQIDARIHIFMQCDFLMESVLCVAGWMQLCQSARYRAVHDRVQVVCWDASRAVWRELEWKCEKYIQSWLLNTSTSSPSYGYIRYLSQATYTVPTNSALSCWKFPYLPAKADADRPHPFRGLPARVLQTALNSRERRISYMYNYAYYVTHLQMDRAGVPVSETSWRIKAVAV